MKACSVDGSLLVRVCERERERARERERVRKMGREGEKERIDL